MAADKEAVCLSRVHMYKSKCILPLRHKERERGGGEREREMERERERDRERYKTK